jgi:hypothetical protein
MFWNRAYALVVAPVSAFALIKLFIMTGLFNCIAAILMKVNVMLFVRERQLIFPL